jgi:ATP-dependent RNA helicase DeaD
MDMRDERRALARGTHIVVATPGRLCDHIRRGTIDLSQVRAVVMDEADEMLDLGFREDLEFILGEAPEDRRTLMFSATVPSGIAALAKSYQKDAERISTVTEARQHGDIEYRLMNVAPQDAENAIINVLRYYEAPNAIVFANTRVMVNRLTTRLSNRGFSVVALSGELSQSERTHALQAMRDGRARVCVATDVAARGIDLPGLDLVVHAELPTNQETLLHRSGRTGRAGRKGVSAMIVPPKAKSRATRLLKWAKLTADHCTAPSAEEIRDKDLERMLADPMWQEPAEGLVADMQATLLEQFSAEQIATAFLKQFLNTHSAPEELGQAPEERPRKDKADFGPSVWFAVTGGRRAGAEPRSMLPMICRAGNLDRDAIGAIRVQDSQTYVELKADAVAGFLKTLDGNMEIEEGAVISQLENAPKLEARAPRAPGSHAGKPRGPKSNYDKPKFDKPRQSKFDKPKPSQFDKPKQPRPPKWKPEHVEVSPAKPSGKPAGKPASMPSGKHSTKPGAKPAGKPDGKPAGKTSYKPKSDGPKGPPPPKGKTSSKKNKARKAAAQASKGGEARPKRPTRAPKKS